jgi:hypothetical protein
MMKLQKIWLFAILLFPSPSHSIQYFYPIAELDQRVYCIYQSSPEIIAMIVWDHEHKEMVPGLLSHFMPAGLRLLPDKSGYSFLDNGILRVKKFMKRSPKSLEFYTPIYNINVPVWIDAQTGYFAAKVRDTYGIFQFDINANLACLLIDPKKDLMYPQKIDTTLFYIERVKRGLGYQFRVLTIEYPTHVDMERDDEMVAFKPILSNQIPNEIFDFNNEPIAFLSMQNANTGFLVSYPEHIEDDAKVIVCSYYQLSQKDGWGEKRLFDFVIPAPLLFKSSGDRLYESILPLLPYHSGNDIYFADARSSGGLNLNLFVYHIANGAIEQLTFADQPDQHFFGPILVENFLYCGGTEFSNGLHFIKMIQL